MASTTFEIEVPKGFRLQTVVHSHGWFHLPPFEWEPGQKKLHAVGRTARLPVSLTIRQPSSCRLELTANLGCRWSITKRREVHRLISRMLGLGIDVDDFYRRTGSEFAWAKRLGAGGLLRGASVFEDTVKVMATTNCSWSLTRQIVGRLVEMLGEPAPDGRLAFPTPEAMARQPIRFYTEEIRAGYRSGYFESLAEKVARGDLDIESWADFDGSTTELARRIQQVDGLGPYAAESLCKLFGRFDGLALDSWCLKKYQKIRGPVTGDVAKAIRKHYEPFGRWQGFALWLDLTRDWHQSGTAADKTVRFEKK